MSCGLQAADNADEEGFLTYTPRDPSGKLIGSDFTSFFLASVVNQTVNGIRLTKVPFHCNCPIPPSSDVGGALSDGLQRQPSALRCPLICVSHECNIVATTVLHMRCNAYAIHCSEGRCRAQGFCTAQGNYTVNAGSNPVSHLWILCNPDIPRHSPFVLDLAGSELMFEVCISAFVGLSHIVRGSEPMLKCHFAHPSLNMASHLCLLKKKKKVHDRFPSQVTADHMPGPPREGQLMCTLCLSTHNKPSDASDVILPHEENHGRIKPGEVCFDPNDAK